VSGNGQTLFVTEKLKCHFKIQCLLSRGEEMGLRHTYIQLFSGPYKDIGPLFFRIFLLPSVFRIYECLFMCFFPYKVFFFFFFGIFTPSLFRNVCLFVSFFFFVSPTTIQIVQRTLVFTIHSYFYLKRILHT
jgi:hypothetical protein